MVLGQFVAISFWRVSLVVSFRSIFRCRGTETKKVSIQQTRMNVKAVHSRIVASPTTLKIESALSILSVVGDATILEWTAFTFILVCWILTFFVSVPLHRKIERNDTTRETRQKLIATNWPRTILWSVIFGLGLF